MWWRSASSRSTSAERDPGSRSSAFAAAERRAGARVRRSAEARSETVRPRRRLGGFQPPGGCPKPLRPGFRASAPMQRQRFRAWNLLCAAPCRPCESETARPSPRHGGVEAGSWGAKSLGAAVRGIRYTARVESSRLDLPTRHEASSILDMLEPATRHPGVVRFLPDGTPTSFTELWRAGEWAAGALAERVPSGGAVAGILTSSVASVATLIGAWRAGITFVSLPMPHRGQTPAAFAGAIDEIRRSFGAELIVAEARYHGLLPGLGATLVAVEGLISTPRAASDRGTGGLVQFSSGTVHRPKPIRLTLHAIGANVRRLLERLALRPGDCSCQWTPLSHDMGLIGGLLAPWAGANRAYLGNEPSSYACIRPEAFLQAPSLWMQTCSDIGATITTSPTFAYALAARELRRSTALLNLRALRACIVGAEPVHPSVLRGFCEAAAPHELREQALTPAYGLAEAALCVTMADPDESWSTASFDIDGSKVELVSCGGPLNDYAVTAGTDSLGPIRISGPSLCESEFSSPTEDLDTGDVGFLRGGELYVAGRVDDIIKVAGRSLRCQDLEEATYGLSEIVRPGNCTVVRAEAGYAVAFECRGSVDARERLEKECVRVRAGLVRSAGLAPSLILVLEPGTLPKTPSGKLKRRTFELELETYRRGALFELGRRPS